MKGNGSRPRVLLVTSMWPTSAEPWRGWFVSAEVEALRELGVQIDVHQIEAGRSWAGYLAAAKSTIADRGSRARYDLVHAYYGHSAVVGMLRVGLPLIITYCGSDLNGVQRQDGSWTFQSRVEVAVFRQLARLARATITKTREMELRLPERCRHRNHVIPTGVDLDRFVPVSKPVARRRLDWPAAAPVALFVGDPALPLKNHRLATAACALARRTIPDLQLKVAWKVPPDTIPLWMHAADVLLFTSQAEGSPNAVKEAMAAELPVVSTPVGDVAERLGGIDGCFVRPPDPSSLAEAVVAAVTNGRSAAARRAVAELSVDRVAKRILSVYEHVR